GSSNSKEEERLCGTGGRTGERVARHRGARRTGRGGSISDRVASRCPKCLGRTAALGRQPSTDSKGEVSDCLLGSTQRQFRRETDGALVVQVTQAPGAETLYSEDLSDRRAYGTVKAINPLRASS